VEEAARQLGIDIPVMTCARAEYMPEEADPERSIVLEPMLREPWELLDEV